jgi:hypothetical protein
VPATYAEVDRSFRTTTHTLERGRPHIAQFRNSLESRAALRCLGALQYIPPGLRCHRVSSSRTSVRHQPLSAAKLLCQCSWHHRVSDRVDPQPSRSHVNPPREDCASRRVSVERSLRRRCAVCVAAADDRGICRCSRVASTSTVRTQVSRRTTTASLGCTDGCIRLTSSTIGVLCTTEGKGEQSLQLAPLTLGQWPQHTGCHILLLPTACQSREHPDHSGALEVRTTLTHQYPESRA